jgi:GNAT superfamily N-acetyltransferase
LRRPPAAAEASTAPGTRRWSAAAAGTRALELLREEGPRSVVFRVLGETVYRRLVLVERDLRCAEPVSVPPGLRFDFLDERGLDEYSTLRPGLRTQAAARLASGDRCFATWLDGRLAAVRWLATGSAHIEYLDTRLQLADDEIYHYDTFTGPNVRRRGVSTATHGALVRRLRDEGWRWSVRALLPENRAAAADAARGGYVARGRIGYVRLGRLRHDFVRWDRHRRPA